MNCFNAIGHIGSDAEVKTLESGVLTKFSVAVKSGWGDKERTSWVNCTLWGDRGEKISAFLKKGKRVGITGELTLREWESDGKSGTSLDCRLSDVTLPPKGEATEAPAEPATADEDQIPF